MYTDFIIFIFGALHPTQREREACKASQAQGISHAGRWLASNGAQQIQLLSRSGRLETVEGALQSLTDPGWAACVSVQKCDVSFAEDARLAFGRSSSKGGLMELDEHILVVHQKIMDEGDMWSSTTQSNYC